MSPTLSPIVNTSVSSCEAGPVDGLFPPLNLYYALHVIPLPELIEHYSDYWFTYPFPLPNYKQCAGAVFYSSLYPLGLVARLKKGLISGSLAFKEFMLESYLTKEGGTGRLPRF